LYTTSSCPSTSVLALSTAPFSARLMLIKPTRARHITWKQRAHGWFGRRW
jgi:hypothetical protein